MGGCVDGDANGRALGQENAVNGRAAGGHDAVVRLRGRWVDAESFFNAGEEVLAVVDAREGDFVWVREG